MEELEMNIMHSIPCVKEGSSGKICWLTAMAEGDYQTALQDDILVCKECATFKEIINRGFGRRTADQALGSTIAKLLRQVADRNIRLNEARRELEQKVEELALMKIITDAVAKTTDLSKALKIILTGVTSGRAFGFNRAGIFLVDQRNEYLEGKDAVGPDNRESAVRIWNELKSLTFEQQVQNILDAPVLKKDLLYDFIRVVRIPLSDPSNIFIQALWAEKPSFFRKSDLSHEMAQAILRHAEFNEFVAVPLKAEGPPLGLMIADNFYSNKPITEASIYALETLANTCTNVLEITVLHEQLSDRLDELERVNRLLRENQHYLMQTERLADIGKLATTVAHEFKTPLVTIGAYARRALRDAGSDKFRRKDLEIIASEVDRLEEITSEILEYSRMAKLELRPLSINKLVRESLEFLDNKLATVGIRLETNYDSTNPTASVDAKRFRQVMFNIIDNAIDAMKSGMVLTVSTRGQDSHVALDIRDTGSGIPDEVRDRIFNPFVTTKARGSGLGLAVSKKIVEDHGGYIEFDSKPGIGTMFSIYFRRVS
jgi:nitrogen-specific signal transduction histidine kinase